MAPFICETPTNSINADLAQYPGVNPSTETIRD
jgi:hypothetical protein